MDSCKEEDDENDMTDDIDTRKDSGSVFVRHEAKFQIESPTGLPSRVDGLVAQVVGRFRRKHERKKSGLLCGEGVAILVERSSLAVRFFLGSWSGLLLWIWLICPPILWRSQRSAWRKFEPGKYFTHDRKHVGRLNSSQAVEIYVVYRDR